MTTPEPLDEKVPAPVEIRGGDRDEDFMQQLPFEPPLPEPGDYACGPDCRCGEDE